MGICKAKRKDGKRCQASAGPSGYCVFHDPKKARARAAGRRLGGKHRRVESVASWPETLAGPEEIRALLEAVAVELEAHENSVSRNKALISLATAAVELWKVGSLEDRLSALEKAISTEAKV